MNLQSEVNAYYKKCEELKSSQYNWLITGVAGFIGSNLLETLLKLNQKVVGLDNFSTGFQNNLEIVQTLVTSKQWKNFTMIDGDICDIKTCQNAVLNIDFVLHQAALGSVPRSLKNPLASNKSNIEGFLNMLVASRDANIKKMVYAASSSTYGDLRSLPKVEENIGNPLSPYAVTKYVNELYANTFSKNYNFHTIGLRYFNVFGPRQNPGGSYAAVIPKWFLAMINDEEITINGDGTTSRDFCFIKNVTQANILSAMSSINSHEVFNISLGDRTSLNELFIMIKNALFETNLCYEKEPIYGDFRKGDVMHSQADISKAIKYFKYAPMYRISEGLKESAPWFMSLKKD